MKEAEGDIIGKFKQGVKKMNFIKSIIIITDYNSRFAECVIE